MALPAELTVVGTGNPNSEMLKFLDDLREQIVSGEDFRIGIFIADGPEKVARCFTPCTLSERILLLELTKHRWLSAYEEGNLEWPRDEP